MWACECVHVRVCADLIFVICDLCVCVCVHAHLLQLFVCVFVGLFVCVFICWRDFVDVGCCAC